MSHSQCNDLASYLLGEMSEEEVSSFLDHINHCARCRREVEELSPLSHRLLDAEYDEHVLSPGLKETTLAAAFTARQPVAQTVKSRTKLWSFRHITTTIAVLMLGVVMGRWTVNLNATQNQSVTPAQMLTEVTLKSVTSVQSPSGMAMLYKRGSQLNLVVYVEKMKPLDYWGCYSVWVTSQGKRTNVGDFTVNPNGDAVLSVTLQNALDARTVQITREPTWNDSTPKGPKVLQVNAL